MAGSQTYSVTLKRSGSLETRLQVLLSRGATTHLHLSVSDGDAGIVHQR